MPDPGFPLSRIERLARRIFPGAADLGVERVAEGVSTYVYRLHRAPEIFYLRVLPEVGSTFAPELLVHGLLHTRGVRVPEVVYYDPRDANLGLSVMVTTQIRGAALDPATDAHTVQSILRAAGQDLALINGVPVAGFGWMRRDQDQVTVLQAEFPTYSLFIQAHGAPYLAPLRRHGILRAGEVEAIAAIFAQLDAPGASAPSCLAHGDLDPIHIYAAAGHYAGLIDFGEIRGADRWYDLGHFQIENAALLPYVLEGYQEVMYRSG